ncbi:MAG: putative low molecular weight protein-tyrosine-phosphatase [Chlamydiia bacterium]|nr:putative low molecular weight protein-tyrosine-phosphatase [Chlamydiia bacterium]
MISVLFVCFGNICRSPALHGFFEERIKKSKKQSDYHVESCGIGAHFAGSDMDARMSKVSEKRGVYFSHKAITFEDAFFSAYDYIFVVTNEIKEYLQESAPKGACEKIYLATHFSKHYKDEEIPDPYYGGEGGFEKVLNMVEDSVDGILEHLESSK